jgi:hypothetical protein
MTALSLIKHDTQCCCSKNNFPTTFAQSCTNEQHYQNDGQGATASHLNVYSACFFHQESLEALIYRSWVEGQRRFDVTCRFSISKVD